MGRYSFIGSHQNLSEAQVNQLHGHTNSGKQFGSTNMFSNIQAMRNFGYTKRRRSGMLSGYSRLRPGHLSGSWFK
jgi:hypothetical protein